jgi:hypothetical protein
MNAILSVGDPDEARRRERALVFLFVNWSGPARDSKLTIQHLLERWQQEAPDQPAPCYQLDLSDQEGPVWDAVKDWLTAQGRPVESLMFGGAGPLLWLRSGTVAAHVPAPFQTRVETLVAISRAVFGSETSPDRPRLTPRVHSSATPIWPDDQFTRDWVEGIAEAQRRADREPYPWEQSE